MNVSYVKINIGNPTIFMSTNSIQNLYFYLKSDYSNTSSLQTKTGSNQKEKLLKSILKAGSYDESVKSKLKTKLYYY